MERIKQSCFPGRFELGRIRVHAKFRWLLPAEVCEYIRSHTEVGVLDEPAHLPPTCYDVIYQGWKTLFVLGGSLFLYNRKILSCYRNDGHNWRKRKDGKTVKEGNEKLKVGNVIGLHCYYCHGEENENFQRRAYWMLDEYSKDFSHMVLVHYLEVKRGRRNFKHSKGTKTAVSCSQESEEIAPSSESSFSAAQSENEALGQVIHQRLQRFRTKRKVQNDRQGNRTNFDHLKETEKVVPYSINGEETACHFEMTNSVSSSFSHQMCPQAMEVTSFSSGQASDFEDAGSASSCVPMTRKINAEYPMESYCKPAPMESYFPCSPSFLDNPLSLDGPLIWDKWDGGSLWDNSFQDLFPLEDPGLLTQANLALQGNRSNFNRFKENEEVVPFCEAEVCSQATDTTSLSSAQASGFRFAESATHSDTIENFHMEVNDWPKQQKSLDTVFSWLQYLPPLKHCRQTMAEQRLHSNTEQNVTTKIPEGLEPTDLCKSSEPSLIKSDKQNDLQVHFSNTGTISKGNDSIEGNVDHASAVNAVLDGSLSDGLKKLDNSNGCGEEDEQYLPDGVSSWPQDETEAKHSRQTLEDQSLHSDTEYNVTTKILEGVEPTDLCKSSEPFLIKSDKQNDLQFHFSNTDTISKRNDSIVGNVDHASAVKPLLDGSLSDGSKKLNNLNRCMAKDVGEPQMHSSSGAYWDTVGSENEADKSTGPLQVRLDSYMLGPSLSDDQFFSIVDFSPNWGYENSGIKVSITGRFLKSQHAESCKWSCMFGEVEVPAEVIADGVLGCYAPPHKAGRVPFYVTCSNRLACSEVKKFEYRVAQIQDDDSKCNGCKDEKLVIRFGNLLSVSSMYPSFNLPMKKRHKEYDRTCVPQNSDLSAKINALLQNGNEEKIHMIQLFSDEGSLNRVKEQLLQQFLKDKFCQWLLQNLAVGGNGSVALDEGGQGVLHIGASLGYDWVLLPMIMAGVSVNFCDVNGWAALHWAAFCGRERTVASLINLGAAPGALTDPCTKYPTGRTAADIASEQGHKGIAGYLAECSLNAHLSSNQQVTLLNMENGSLPKKEMEITSVRGTFKSQQQNGDKVYMKSFDPTNCSNELLENRFGVLQNSIMGNVDTQIGLFTLKELRPLDECELLRFIFAKNTLSDDQRHTLVETDTVFLTRHTVVWSVKPNGWLYGDVIDVFAEYLWLGGSKHVFYFPSTFSNKVDTVIGGREKTVTDPTEFAEFVSSIGLKKFDEHISQCRKIFVPLHDVNHWYLLVVHIDSQIAELWDSLNPTPARYNHCKDVLEALDILYDKVEFQLLKTKKFSDYKLSEAVQCPRQVGGSDCGVYVVRHMQRYGKEWWHEFDSQEQRMDLAIELVKNSFNLAWEKVSAYMIESTANCS